MLLQLQTITNLYSENPKTGVQKVIKKNIITNLSIYSEEIIGTQQMFNSKGNIDNTKTRILCKNALTYVVKGSHQKITQLLEEEIKPIKGFIR